MTRPPTTIRDTYRWCLLHGLNAIPGRPRSKEVAIEGRGAYQVVARAEYLEKWFPAGEERNIGVTNGELSGNLCDLDLDSHVAVMLAPRLLPATSWRFSRAGADDSAHRLYRTDVAFSMATREYSDPATGGKLFEVRGTGHWSIWPPSVHPSGSPIVWESVDDQGPPKGTLAGLEKAAGVLGAACVLATSWPSQGRRHDASLALAGGLLRAGWSVEEVEQFLEAVAEAARDEEVTDRVRNVRGTREKLQHDEHVTGWPKLAELLGDKGGLIVDRVRGWLGLATGDGRERREPATARRGPRYRPLPTFHPFPVEAMPAVVGAYATAAAENIGCDVSLVAVPALGVMGGAIGNSRAIVVKAGWTEPPAVWAVTVAESGGHKSPAYAAATDAVNEFQSDLFDEYKEVMERHHEAVEKWKATPPKERGPAPEPPPEPPSLVLGDATIECVGERLRDNPRGVLLAVDELDTWFSSFCRYKGKGGGSDRAQWLQLHRAGKFQVDRLSREKGRIDVRRALASVVGTVQPGVLAKVFAPEAMSSGLAARFLMTMPPRRCRRWSETELSEVAAGRYADLLRSLLALELDDHEKRKPRYLGLSGPAKERWVEFYNAFAQEQHQAHGEQASALAKLEAYCARLALIHHVVGCAAADVNDKRPIGEKSVEAAVTLTKWFANEAYRIYTMLRESEGERDTRVLVEWIAERGGSITVRGLQRANSRRWPTREDALQSLNGLVDGGLGVWVEGDANAGGGHRIWTFQITCPTHDTSDTRSDDYGGGGDQASDTRSDTRPPSGGGWRAWDDANHSNSDACGERREGGSERVSEVSCVERVVADQERGGSPPRVSEASVGGECRRPAEPKGASYRLITTPEELAGAGIAIEESALVALDTETTGLDPRRGKVRLLSLGVDTTDGGTFTYLVDCFAVDPAPLWGTLAGKSLVMHNASFDLPFLAGLGFVPTVPVHCTMTLSRLVYAGERSKHGLRDCAKRELGRDLDKDEQKSNWSGNLTPAQLTYAAADVEVLRPLLDALTMKAGEAELTRVADVEARCVPALAWVATSGVAVDREAWRSLVEDAEAEAARLKKEMAAAAPTRPGEMFASWNWDSSRDTKTMFHALGLPVQDTADATLAETDHPLARTLREYRSAKMLTGTFGKKWLSHVAADGRVYPTWVQTGSEAGRMSCKNPNLQQIPRDPRYRKCFRAPPGRVLVKADYSQIELRIAAKVTGDEALLAAYAEGIDVHTQTARRVLGKDKVSQADRQLAKALNFGLLYGMGVDRFLISTRSEYGIDLTKETAEQYRDDFFRAYPGLKAWHRRIGRTGENEVETRTALNRRRLKVSRYSEKLNTPVQGTGGDGLKVALALLWERRGEQPGSFPVLVVHDEIVVECDEGRCGPVSEWLKTAMVDGMSPLLEPVPVEVEVKVARTWGG